MDAAAKTEVRRPVGGRDIELGAGKARGSVPADSQRKWRVVPAVMSSPSNVKSSTASRVTQAVVDFTRMASSTAAGAKGPAEMEAPAGVS
jgi:hypothetical protein